MKKKPQLICSTSDNLQKSEELLQSGSEVNSFQRHQRATLRIHCVGPTGLEESAMHYPLVKSHWGCRLTPGQMSFHGRNENVWPNPLFPLIKMDISELSEGEVWVFRDSRWLLADRGLPFPIGSVSPVALSPTVRYNGFPMGSKPVQLWQAVHFSLSSTHYIHTHAHTHSFTETRHCFGSAVQFPRSSWENISLVPHRVMLATLRYKSWV